LATLNKNLQLAGCGQPIDSVLSAVSRLMAYYQRSAGSWRIISGQSVDGVLSAVSRLMAYCQRSAG
jgi:hypothetical protein